MSLAKKIKLNDGEKIRDIVQRYWITYFWSWLIILMFFTIPFFFMFWLFNHEWWGQSLFFISVLVAIFLLTRTLFIWRKNALIITTHRIIDIDQRGFFEKIISDIELSDVEDVAGKIKGFWSTIFKYGTTIIEADEGRVQIIAEKIKHPEILQKNIKFLRKIYLTEDAKKLEGDIAKAITKKLHELGIEELREIEIVIQKKIRRLQKNEDNN